MKFEKNQTWKFLCGLDNVLGQFTVWNCYYCKYGDIVFKSKKII